MQGPKRKAVHRGDADDVDFGIQATRPVQRIKSIRQPAGQGERLRTAAARLLAEPRERHLLGQQRVLPRLPDCGRNRDQGSHRRAALYLHRTPQVHAGQLPRQEDAGALAYAT